MLDDSSRRGFLKGIIASIGATAVVVTPKPELWEPDLWKPGDPITGIHTPVEQSVDGRVYLKTKEGQFVSLGGIHRYDISAPVDAPFTLDLQVFPNMDEFRGIAELLSIALIDQRHRDRRLREFEIARKQHGL